MRRLCPHCGYDLCHDTPALHGDFYMSGPLGEIRWKEQVIKLTAAQSSVCYTLMKNYPNPVTLEVILERLGSEAATDVVAVHVCRIRKLLRAIGAPDPIKARQHRGGKRAYAWIDTD